MMTIWDQDVTQDNTNILDGGLIGIANKDDI